MTTDTHPFTESTAPPTPMSDPDPDAETHTKLNVAVARPDDQEIPIPGFLPSTREFPVGVSVTSGHERITDDGSIELAELPFEIIRTVDLPRPMTIEEIRSDLRGGAPQWFPRELAAGRFAETDESWLEAWQAHRLRLDEIRDSEDA